MHLRPITTGPLIVAVIAIVGLFAVNTNTSAGEPAGPGGIIIPPPITIDTCALSDDAFEENDALVTAFPVSLPFSGTNLCSRSGDDDWFAFSVSQGGEIQVDATFTHADGDVDIELYYQPAAPKAFSHSATNNEKLTHTALTSGIYLVRVHLVSGSYNDYALEISATCPPASGAGTVFSDALEAPLGIPDAIFFGVAGVENCIQVSDARQVSDLNVALDISHTHVGSLTVTLTHQDTGTSVILIDRPGTPPDYCDGDDIDATLDDEAFSPVQDECFGGTPTIDGTFTPNAPLSAFDGESMAGTWTLHVLDHSIFSDDTLNGWSLIASLEEPTAEPTTGPTNTPGPAPTATTPPANTPTVPAVLPGDVNCDGFVNAVDAALILQLGGGLIGSLPCDENADANDDGTVNAIDAALVLQFTAQLIDNLPP